MTRFLRAAVEVLAFQWKNQPLEEWPEWAREAAEGGQNGSLWKNGMHLSIDSPKGPQQVRLGGWVVCSEKGLEAVTEEEFTANFQPLDTASVETVEVDPENETPIEEPEDPEDDSDNEEEIEIEEEGTDEEEKVEEQADSGDGNGTKAEVSSNSDAV